MLKNNHEEWEKLISNFISIAITIVFTKAILSFCLFVQKIYGQSASLRISELQLLTLGLRTWAMHKEGKGLLRNSVKSLVFSVSTGYPEDYCNSDYCLRSKVSLTQQLSPHKALFTLTPQVV